MNNIPFHWRARTISNKLVHRCNNERVGKVHSVFNTSFNLVFGDKLVHVGSDEAGLAPFGIGLERDEVARLTKQVRVGERVNWDNHANMIRFSSGELLLGDAEKINHRQETHPYDYSIVERNFMLLCEEICNDLWETGLVQTRDGKESLMDYLMCRNIADQETMLDANFNTLFALAHGETEVNALSVFDYWIGRGPGLTPSGDDLITGLCSVLYTLGKGDGQFVRQLDQYVRQYGPERTTQVSLEYLLYAVKGEFHSHLIQLVSQLLKPWDDALTHAILQMKQLGHTSGTDTLIGVLFGLRTVIIK